MCTKTYILVIVLILKILIFLIPLAIYILKKTGFIEEFIKYFYLAEFTILIILISLCFFGSDCIKNSSISGIKLNHKLFDNIDYIDEDKLAIDYKSINPSKVYQNDAGVDINYYNINSYPIKNIEVYCNKKSYFQNYGNDIAAIATGISSIGGIKTNPTYLIEYLEKTGLISCEKQASIDEILSSISYAYKTNFRPISVDELSSNVNAGKVVLAKTKVIDENINLSCGEKLITIYQYNSKGEYNILNPSDKLNDYFCPSNTAGYGSIVKGDQNSTSYNINDLSKYISEYYVVEVR